MRCFLHRVTAEDSHSLQDPCRMHVEKAIDCKERTPVRESLPLAALRQRSAAVPDHHSVTPTARTFLIFEPPMPCVPCTSGSALSPFPQQASYACLQPLSSLCLLDCARSFLRLFVLLHEIRREVFGSQQTHSGTMQRRTWKLTSDGDRREDRNAVVKTLKQA